MSGISDRPGPVSPGPSLRLALHELHLNTGAPSTRKIARDTGNAISHDTVHRVLTSKGLPRWGPLEHVVKALGGDVATFRALWVSEQLARDQDSG